MKAIKTKIFIIAIGIYALTMTFFGKPETSVYSVKQTVEALGSVRNLHVIRRGESGDIEIERWMEINADGTQVKYFQETVNEYLVMEDATTRLIYIIEQNAILIDDRDDTSITWIAGFNSLFKDMAMDDSVTIEDYAQDGQKQYIIRWQKHDIRCIIDPETKLPIAVGNMEIHYEYVPRNVFNKLQIPKTATLVDRRESSKDDGVPYWSESLNII